MRKKEKSRKNKKQLIYYLIENNLKPKKDMMLKYPNSGGSTENTTCILMSDNRMITSDFSNANYVSIVSAINYNYAKKQGYDFIYYMPEILDQNKIKNTINSPNIKLKTNSFNSLLKQHRSPPWSKLLSLWDTISKKYNTIVYVDSDCAIVNQNISIEDYIQQSKYINGDKDSDVKFLVDKPYGIGPCSGFIILKNTKNTKKILKYWWNYNMPNVNTKHPFEQGALNDMVQKLDTNIMPYYGLIDDLMFIEKDGQFLRHIGSNNDTERVPKFTCWYNKLYNKDQFTDIINTIINNNVKKKDTIEIDLQIQKSSGGSVKKNKSRKRRNLIY